MQTPNALLDMSQMSNAYLMNINGQEPDSNYKSYKEKRFIEDDFDGIGV